MSVFLERFSMWNMFSCAEQGQIQEYKTHAYKTLKTAGVQTIMLKHPTKRLKKKKKPCSLCNDGDDYDDDDYVTIAWIVCAILCLSSESSECV